MKNLLPLCLALSITLFSGCAASDREASEGTDWEPTPDNTVNNLDGVTMTVKEDSVTPSGLTAIIENESDKQCTYGEYFSLEKESAGTWYQVPVILEDNYGFNEIGFDLPPGDVQEWTADWEWLYGKLDAGNYRIVKDILDVRQPGDYDTYYLAAEFTIK